MGEEEVMAVYADGSPMIVKHDVPEPAGYRRNLIGFGVKETDHGMALGLSPSGEGPCPGCGGLSDDEAAEGVWVHGEIEEAAEDE